MARRWVCVAELHRGAIVPPEALSEAESRKVEMALMLETKPIWRDSGISQSPSRREMARVKTARWIHAHPEALEELAIFDEWEKRAVNGR